MHTGFGEDRSDRNVIRASLAVVDVCLRASKVGSYFSSDIAFITKCHMSILLQTE